MIAGGLNLHNIKIKFHTFFYFQNQIITTMPTSPNYIGIATSLTVACAIF